MPTPRQQVEQRVDALIAESVIPRDMRDQYINMLAGNDTLASRFSNELAGGAYFTQRAQQEAEQRRQAQAQIEAERQAVQAERQRLEQWQQTAERELAEAKARGASATELATKAALYEQALREYAPAVLEQIHVPQIPAPSYQPPTQTAPSPATPGLGAGYVKMEDVQSFARELVDLQSKTNRINSQHYRLFGTFPEDDVVSEALRANQDPEAYWRAKYNVGGREAQLASERQAAEVARIREEERSKLMAEMAIDPSRIVGGPGQGSGQASILAQTYMAEAARQRSPLAPDPNAAPVSPEMRPDLQTTFNRVSNAAGYFAKNFAPDGTPLTGEAQKAVAQHGYGSV